MQQDLFKSADQWTVFGEYDIAVIGAGPGGIASAISAARQGMRVILVERYGFPGGVSTLSACPVFLGFSFEGKQIVGGFADEFVRKLDNYGEASFLLEDPKFFPDFLPVADKKLNRDVISTTEAIRITLNRMLVSEGVTRLFFSTLIGAYTDHRTIRSVAVMCAEGPMLIKAKCFVDATGDANLVYYAGGEVREASIEESMAKSLFFDVGGVSLFDKRENQKIYNSLYEAGKVPQGLLVKFSTCTKLEPGVVNICLGMTSGNALVSSDLTRMDMELREQIPVIIDFLRKEIPGFKNCYIINSSIHIGIRAGRSIVGLETIGTNEIDSGIIIKEPVTLVRRSYGHHSVKDEDRPAWHKDNPGLTAIPMKTLIPRSFDNVIAAGRSISYDAKVIDTIRLMASCFSVGEAAGTIASIAVKEKSIIPSVEYKSVRSHLVRNGAILEPE